MGNSVSLFQEANLGCITPPVRMSDAASDNTNQFVYVRRVLLRQTRAQTKQFATTITTERIPRETETGISCACPAMFVAWFNPLKSSVGSG